MERPNKILKKNEWLTIDQQDDLLEELTNFIAARNFDKFREKLDEYFEQGEHVFRESVLRSGDPDFIALVFSRIPYESLRNIRDICRYTNDEKVMEMIADLFLMNTQSNLGSLMKDASRAVKVFKNHTCLRFMQIFQDRIRLSAAELEKELLNTVNAVSKYTVDIHGYRMPREIARRITLLAQKKSLCDIVGRYDKVKLYSFAKTLGMHWVASYPKDAGSYKKLCEAITDLIMRRYYE